MIRAITFIPASGGSGGLTYVERASRNRSLHVLLQDLRDALDQLEIANGQEYLLTSCFGAAQERMESIEWDYVVPLVDMKWISF